MSYLFLRFAVVRYYIIDEGLMVKGLFNTKTRGWHELGTLRVNGYLKYFSVRNKTKGIKIVQEPKNHAWAYEMQIEDIDGNILWLGTAPKTNIPTVDPQGE